MSKICLKSKRKLFDSRIKRKRIVPVEEPKKREEEGGSEGEREREREREKAETG
jgi:hypothetical protein